MALDPSKRISREESQQVFGSGLIMPAQKLPPKGSVSSEKQDLSEEERLPSQAFEREVAREYEKALLKLRPATAPQDQGQPQSLESTTPEPDAAA